MIFEKTPQINRQLVILSLSNFHRVDNEVKARGVAEAGSRNESRWLFKGEVTFVMASHSNLFGDPFVALLLGFTSLSTR